MNCCLGGRRVKENVKYRAPNSGHEFGGLPQKHDSREGGILI